MPITTPTRTHTPTPPSSNRKLKTGIHLGTRGNDWPSVSLERLRGTQQGSWPAAVMVLSSNVYTIVRSGPGCTVSDVQVANWNVFDFLRDAAVNGVKILIRLHPSPGNFEDALNPNSSTLQHRLIFDSPTRTPENSTFCDGREQIFRTIDDLAREMHLIHDRNQQGGWSEFGFEPANEPNDEWYRGQDVHISDQRAWTDMNGYFSNLYDYMHATYPGIRALTPTMSQNLYAETRQFSTCNPMVVAGTNQSGYQLMNSTYTAKNDGFAWHNYWRHSYEAWDNIFCAGNNPPSGDHIFQYFPTSMQSTILASGKLAFITEADLFSPCQWGSTVTNKDNQAQETADSLRLFVAAEAGADIVIGWLLTNGQGEPTHPPTCHDSNSEMAWHEAWRDDGGERTWFPLWWSAPE